MRQPVQRVVQILNGVAVTVGLLGQVVVGVILVSLAQRRGERGLGRPAKGVIGERRLVAVGVGDGCEVAFCIVGVVRDVAGRVGDAGCPVLRLWKGGAFGLLLYA